MLCTFNSIEDLNLHLADDLSDTVYLLVRGFQSLNHFTAIPIRPLTLLYGPNSAGKSAIFDALSYLESSFASETQKGHFNRWHNLKSPEISVGFSWKGNLAQTIQWAWWCDMGFSGNVLHEIDESTLDPFFQNTEEFRQTWLIRDALSANERIVELYAKSISVATIRITDDDNCSEFSISRSGVNALGACPKNTESLWRMLKDLPQGLNQDNSDKIELFDTSHEMFWVEWKELTTSTESANRPRVRPYSTELSSSRHPANLSDLIRIFFIRPRLRLTSSGRSLLIGPLRPIFSDSQLKFICEPGKQAAPLSGDTRSAIEIWKILATEVAQGVSASNSASELSEKTKCQTLLQEANRWLNDPQFFGAEYKLNASTYWVTPTDPETAENSENRNIIVEIWVENSSGNRLGFLDVGTGFSQVIPIVLSALTVQATLAVEQPELHLHPRVQHSVADLFIESLHRDRCKFCIVETHSEHIMLRTLRRIRETGQSRIPHSRLKLTPANVSVLYFEPDEGQTYVHELRVTDEGEFMDKWPKGFFEERYEDLFDEPRMGG
jgi:hypothetical protein